MLKVWAAAFAALTLAACATTPPPRPTRPSRPPAPHGVPPRPLPPAPPPRPEPPPSSLEPLSSLPGWSTENHAAALKAFQAGCGASRDGTMRNVCAKARALGDVSPGAARSFFEFHFRAERLSGEGVLTAYFAPEYEARLSPSAEFSAPVRPKPSPTATVMVAGAVAAPPVASDPAPPPVDPSDASSSADPIGDVLGGVTPAPPEAASSLPPPSYAPPPPPVVSLATADRATIETAPIDRALAWMRPEELFYLQIQGSGTLRFPDGKRLKAAYSGDNGKPFVAIARPMVSAGMLAANKASGENIRSWLASHRGAEADAVMRKNPRYVFFNLIPDDGREPPGAAGIPLPAERAIAVDPSRHAYGEVFWIDAEAPILTGAAKTYRRLVVALDTGAAIRGDIRADLYIGRGPEAGAEAGRVRHTLHMVRLVPMDPDL